MDRLAELQSKWLGDENDNLRTTEQTAAADVINLLDSLKSALTKPNRPAVNSDHNLTIPFILSDVFATFGAIVDRYYERLRELFSFDVDNPRCCQQRAAADESVFLLCNFLIEMPNCTDLHFTTAPIGICRHSTLSCRCAPIYPS
jgi:hypothetical protein